MLISDKYQFIVACPTKMGTNTMRALATQWSHNAEQPDVLRLLRGEENTRHRLAPPLGLEHYSRLMMAREPFARLVSMYEYLRRKDWEWESRAITQHEAEMRSRVAGFRYMLHRIVQIKSDSAYYNPGKRATHGIVPYKWTDTPGQMQSFLQGFDANEGRLPWFTRATPTLIRLENLERDWEQAMHDHGVEEPGLRSPEFAHRNATRTEKYSDDLSDYLDAITPRLYRQVVGWEPDQYKKFGVYHRAS